MIDQIKFNSIILLRVHTNNFSMIFVKYILYSY